MQEEWVNLPDYHGMQINTQGQVRNGSTGVLRKISVNQNGYLYYPMRNDNTGKYENKSVARLVAETFVAKTNPTHDTPIHVDGDRTNCSIDNLRWASRWDAIAYHRDILEPRYSRPRQILAIFSDGEQIIFRSLKEAAQATLVLPNNIAYAMDYNDNMDLSGRATTYQYYSRIIFKTP